MIDGPPAASENPLNSDGRNRAGTPTSSGSGSRPGSSRWTRRWSFVEGLREGVYGVDTQGLCTFINRAALRMLGYPGDDELMGRNMHQMVHHTHADGTPFPAEACPLLHTLTSGRAVQLDSELLWRRDGSSFVAEYSSYPIIDDDGRIEGSAITFIERSADRPGPATLDELWGSAERRRAEDALRASEAKFRALADLIPQLAWMTDASGAIVWYNRRWYDYTGTTPEQMQGWGWRDVHHPDHAERVIAHISAAFANGLEWEDTFPLRGRDGQYRWFLSRAVPIRSGMRHQDDITGWFGTNTDINDIREAEERLNAAMTVAEEANRAKSDFIANMSHELRTPLSAIIGYSEMMQEEIGDEADPTELAPDLRKIESNARHLLGLINDVLDLSKIESGRMEVFPEEVDVLTVVREVSSTVQGLVAKKANSLVLELAEPLGSMHTDVTKLRQILLNLLSNAAKFTEAGTITLSATRIDAAGPEEWMAFRVSDTGIGMAEEQLGKLFQRFSQADASTTRRFGGTGLGLSISKAFSVMLGGDIAVESAPGEGTAFSVLLPVTAREARSTATAGDAGSGSTPESGVKPATARNLVLVIDDDQAQRDLMSRFLDREGFEARTAANGRTGLQLARVLKPKVILLDVMMPGMDGWSVLSALKADPGLADTPVVMISFVNERGLAQSLGAAEYVLKPVEWGRFKQVMDRFRGAAGDVLVVDDDADTRQRMRVALERDGWSVAEASHGQEALDRIATATPALVLLDLNMPVMDGFTFLARFRALPDCADIPVIVLTASDLTSEDRKRLRGASQILNKGDTSLGALAHEISELAEGSDGKSDFTSS